MMILNTVVGIFLVCSVATNESADGNELDDNLESALEISDSSGSDDPYNEITQALNLQSISVTEGMKRNYCRLLPYAELSSLLAIQQLSQDTCSSSSTSINATVISETQRLHYSLGLYAEAFALCIMSRHIGPHKTLEIKKQWLSGYQSLAWKAWKENTNRHFNRAIYRGQNFTRSCMEWIRRDIDQSLLKMPREQVYMAVLNDLQAKLAIGKLQPIKLIASIETFAKKCLFSTPGVAQDPEIKRTISIALGKASVFFHRMESKVLPRNLPDDKESDELVTLLADGVIKSAFLEPREKIKRTHFMLRGQGERRQCQTMSGADDCIV